MKGVVIERALPGNAIDLMPLVLEAIKAGVFTGPLPSQSEIKNQWYWTLLTQELPNPLHKYYLAKRGRGYLGYLHAVFIPNRWTGKIDSVFVDAVYVIEKRRKNGIGRKLINALIDEAEKVGIKRFDFMVADNQIEYWMKTRNAKKITNLMRVEL